MCCVGCGVVGLECGGGVGDDGGVLVECCDVEVAAVNVGVGGRLSVALQLVVVETAANLSVPVGCEWEGSRRVDRIRRTK